jgi:hypothetical protein
MAKRSQVKQKRTFSLSPESVEYLETVRKQKKAPSTSTVLDEMIREQRHAAELAATDARISAYYDSLSEEQQADDLAWGKYALSQFPKE